MKTYVIAEMAWSHTGYFKKAIEMLEGASSSGADAISIHITDMGTYMTEDYRCIAGVTLSDSADDEQSIYDFLESINLSHDDWLRFSSKADELNIDLVVMCNDQISFEFSKKINVKKYVVSAASFLELDLIEDIVSYNNDIILRTGGATIDEIDTVLEHIYNTDETSKVCLLAGIQLYPTPIEDMHISSLSLLHDRYKRPGFTLGLADHIDGDHPYAEYLPAISLALGSTVLEKHITTDREEKLEDYEAALGIDQFKTFVDYVREAEKAIGEKSLDYMNDNESYKKYRLVGRKKIVASRDLVAGEILTNEMLSFKRADYGAQLESLESILGKKLLIDRKVDEAIDIEHIEK
tara:strand:+ start:101 stop:1153 length:1053 start_codon:yes stop_codon:yes gene_type:complete